MCVCVTTQIIHRKKRKEKEGKGRREGSSELCVCVRTCAQKDARCEGSCVPCRVCVCKVHDRRKDWQRLDWVGLYVSPSFFGSCVYVCVFLLRRR